MDNRKLIIYMLLGLGLILLYNSVLVPWLDQKMGWNVATTQPATTEPSSQPAVNPASQPIQTAASAPTTSAPAMTAQISGSARIVPVPSSAAAPVSLGSASNNDSQFAIQLNIQPRGASVSSVILNQFKKQTRSDDRYVFQQPLASNPEIAAFASRSVTVDQKTYDLAGVEWSLISSAPMQAVYAARLVQEERPLLEIRKTYRIYPRSSDNEGFEIQVEYSFNNLTDQPLSLQTDFVGPVMPPGETFRSPDRQVVGGYVNSNSIDVESHAIEEFTPDKNSGNIDLTKKDSRPARWTGAASTYFGAILLPDKPEDITSIMAHGVNLDEDSIMDEHDVYIDYQTRQFRVDPHGSSAMGMSAFFGPKWRQILDQPHYAAFPREYNLMLIIRGGMCAFCTFAWLVDAIVWFLRTIHAVVHDWGLAIIGLVAIVRIILHPITRYSQISMSKMSKMGPEMKRLQEKYKDDKDALSKAMVQFHKEQGLGPYLGCLPMFLQMPIWIALYGVLQSTFELRQAPFLGHLTWIRDLSQPDYVWKFAYPLFVNWRYLPTIRGICIVPFLLAAAMFLQQQFMPKPVAATPEQMQQQKMMQWISPIMFLLIFYSYPSGLNLYIATSTAVGIMESKIVRDHLRKREEAEKAGKVFVETKPTRGSRQGKSISRPEQPKGWMARMMDAWAKIQQEAERKRDQDRRDDRDKKKRP